MPREKQELVATCLKEQNIYETTPPINDSVSPWTTFIYGAVIGIIAGAWIGHK